MVSTCAARWLDDHRFVADLGGLLLAESLTMLGYGIVTVLLVAFVRETLHGSALVFGWLFAAQGIGGIIGGVLIGRFGSRVAPARLFAAGLMVTGACFAVMITLPSLPLTLVLGILVGMAVAAYVVGQRTVLQTRVAPGYLGRVAGLLSTSQSLALLLGMGLASALGTPLGATVILDVAAGVYLLAGFLAVVLISQQAWSTTTTTVVGATLG